MKGVALAQSSRAARLAGRRGRRGQAMVEYVVVCAALLGFGIFGWPFTTKLINALDAYYQSIYYVIQSPIP